MGKISNFWQKIEFRFKSIFAIVWNYVKANHGKMQIWPTVWIFETGQFLPIFEKMLFFNLCVRSPINSTLVSEFYVVFLDFSPSIKLSNLRIFLFFLT